MRYTRIIAVVSVLLVASWASAAAPRIGRASGSMGSATIDGQKIAINSPVFEGSKIVTGANDAASVLLDSNVVLKFDADTSAIVTEAKGTHVKLLQGNVEIFLAKRGPLQGAVALSDPDASIEALGTVVVASYTPATRDGWYATLESTRAQGVSVQGNADAASSDVPAGKHAVMHAGHLTGIFNTDPNDLKAHTLSITQLEAVLNRQAGTFLRQQTAIAAAVHLAISNGRQITMSASRDAVADSQQLALTNGVQFTSVNHLVASGVLGSSSGAIAGPSSGGFTNASVLLSTGDILSFRLFDPGVQDGDQVSMKIIDNGSTVFSLPLVTLTNAGQVYMQKVAPGTVNISLTALNQGAIPPNTGGVAVLNTVQTGSASQAYNITTGQTATLQLKVK